MYIKYKHGVGLFVSGSNGLGSYTSAGTIRNRRCADGSPWQELQEFQPV